MDGHGHGKKGVPDIYKCFSLGDLRCNNGILL